MPKLKHIALSTQDVEGTWSLSPDGAGPTVAVSVHSNWYDSQYADPSNIDSGVGASQPPGRLTPALLQGAQTLMVERAPWEAEIPFEALAAAPFPKLVVSGAHNPAFEAVADVLEHGLGAQRAVLPGAGHSVQRLGKPFNELLAAFIRHAERA